MGVSALDDSCGGNTEINILLVSNQYFSPHTELKVEEKKILESRCGSCGYGCVQAIVK